MAYPFGVIGVVLFVQIMPKLLKADMARSALCWGLRPQQLLLLRPSVEKKPQKRRIELDEFGFGAFGIAVVLGIILGSIKIPLSADASAAPASRWA